MNPLHFSRVIASGSYLPGEAVSNQALVERLAKLGVESSSDWIETRSGIRARHFAVPGVKSSDLGAEAARRALGNAGLNPNDIDLVVVATSTPDYLGAFPSTACVLQKKLGISNHCPALDVQAVCTGFIYALTVADALIRTGSAKRALVVGTEVFSHILDFHDRSTCVLFGDGAGAFVLAADSAPGILASSLHANGEHSDILCLQGHLEGGQITDCGADVEGNKLANHRPGYLFMDGQAVFKLAVGVLADVAQETLRKAGLETADIDWLVPHQANSRIMEATAKKLSLPIAKMVSLVAYHGNTSAASIPLAFDAASVDGRIKPGNRVLLEGVGGGFSWGAVAFQM